MLHIQVDLLLSRGNSGLDNCVQFYMIPTLPEVAQDDDFDCLKFEEDDDDSL